MHEKTYTVQTRLNKDSELVQYSKDYLPYFTKIYRCAWQIYTSKSYSFKDDNEFRKYLCNRFNILARTANSIIRDIRSKVQAQRSLKKLEIKQLNAKIATQKKRVEDIENYINYLKPLVRDNKANDWQVRKYRAAKQSLFYQKNRLNKMKQNRDNLIYKINNKIFSIGWGSKKMFKKQYQLTANNYNSHEQWYRNYIKARDKNIYYTGTYNETQGNQAFQMFYNPDMDNFTIKVRKEHGYDKDGKYIEQMIDFKYQKELLKEYCIFHLAEMNPNPLTYRIRRVNNKWYLDVILTISYDDYETSNKYGTIGLDFNDGFIEASETDERGNLIHQYHYDLRYHKQGNKAKTEMEQIVSRIVNIAKSKGKDIVIEDLDFTKALSQRIKGKTKARKKFNEMLKYLDSGRYKSTLENCCHRRKVNLIPINPYNTSKIGKQKYSDKMKLSAHQAASFVIARRGQGFVDKLAS